ncbi:PRC-barrel domain protein [Methanobrevibacter cuticularis]|uniref:PRC-barrel domain protein n=1 Tax=Methanobrevibacter cuticularis TaxID=47311 RepID=A0A166CMQ2_9EURY|nr:PRC-barrel domain-containing protein [Methanobrevibacter cuticularis]KZX14671.1 PRC-barrel domain protein [Methanobrevibacter cuticularis]
MKASDLIGKDVIDGEGNTLGKVENLVIDEYSGVIKGIDVKEKPNLISSEVNPIIFRKINNITNIIKLKPEII